MRSGDPTTQRPGHMTELVRYDEMCRAIDAAYEVDEVKDIRDKAAALEHYAKQATNIEAERRACEIRLRAERKVGKLLREVARAQGRRSDLSISCQADGKSFKEHLDDHRISETQASRWQKLAGVPEEEFEAALAAPGKPNTIGIIGGQQKQKPMDRTALWVWGRLRDFERDSLFDIDPRTILDEMTEPMKADVRRLVGPVTRWLKEIVDELRRILADIYERRNDELRISPSWLATEAMNELDAGRESPELMGRPIHKLQLRQIARAVCRQRFETHSEALEQHELFPELQAYPSARSQGDEEPEYVLLEHMTEEDVNFNVTRLRLEGLSKLRHAYALESWWENHSDGRSYEEATGDA